MKDNSENSAKAVLRMHMRNLRRQFVRDHPEADWQAGDKASEMLAALKFKRPGVIAVYRAAGNEMDPRPLGENLIALGWSIALPACEQFDTPIVFRAWAPGDRLAPDVMGIAAPLAAAEVRPDIIIAPVLAYDFFGNRLGQGGGYYDRTLEALRDQARPPAYVGLAFAAQEVDQVPVYEHDQRLDAILTETGYRPFS